MKTKKPLIDKKGAAALSTAITEVVKEAAGKLAAALPSIPGIVDPMLIKGTFTRAQIMDEVRRLRPDFKDPSAAVSNGMRRQQAAGNHPALVEIPRERKAPRPKSGKRTTRNPDARLPVVDRLAKLDAWAARVGDEVHAGFKRRDEFLAAAKLEPKHHRIWP